MLHASWFILAACVSLCTGDLGGCMVPKYSHYHIWPLQQATRRDSLCYRGLLLTTFHFSQLCYLFSVVHGAVDYSSLVDSWAVLDLPRNLSTTCHTCLGNRKSTPTHTLYIASGPHILRRSPGMQHLISDLSFWARSPGTHSCRPHLRNL